MCSCVWVFVKVCECVLEMGGWMCVLVCGCGVGAWVFGCLHVCGVSMCLTH